MDIRTEPETGLTLLELLITIAVLALLALLAIPSIGAIQERFRAIGCINNLRQFGVVFMNYSNDHSGYLPRSSFKSDGGVIEWQDTLDEYIIPKFSELGKLKVKKSIYLCPSQPLPIATCYGLNQQLRAKPGAKNEESLIRRSEIVAPSGYVLLADTLGSRWITAGKKEKMENNDKLTARHNKIPNFLYADGHAAPFTRELLGYSDAPGDPFYQSLWDARYQPKN